MLQKGNIMNSYAERINYSTNGKTNIIDITDKINSIVNNSRIIAQHGWFTSHKFSRKTNNFVALKNIYHYNPCIF